MLANRRTSKKQRQEQGNESAGAAIYRCAWVEASKKRHQSRRRAHATIQRQMIPFLDDDLLIPEKGYMYLPGYMTTSNGRDYGIAYLPPTRRWTDVPGEAYTSETS